MKMQNKYNQVKKPIFELHSPNVHLLPSEFLI